MVRWPSRIRRSDTAPSGPSSVFAPKRPHSRRPGRICDRRTSGVTTLVGSAFNDHLDALQPICKTQTASLSNPSPNQAKRLPRSRQFEVTDPLCEFQSTIDRRSLSQHRRRLSISLRVGFFRSRRGNGSFRLDPAARVGPWRGRRPVRQVL
jgi:hypothetical protein